MALTDHLREWLGAWPPTGNLDVTGSPRRTQPGWDGRVHPALGVGTPEGAVLSVPPEHVARVRAVETVREIPALIGFGDRGWFEAVYRWTTEPAPLADAGEWVPATDDGVPEWLRVFGGEVLVAVDPETGEHLAGVGIKRHDRYGRELSVVTAPEARGRGLARRLVAQAARRVLDEGAVPTYMHAVSNTASAAVAKAAGFPDLGWTAFGVAEH
ncbi:GNAT family N-acetyltransferase [Nonomuraea sp. WAC 01424]|uniref:GNAT family N-acetyltransferase n=1 Tax=Nonomuraea sp. WAC 01424 TaxID=2203200 RepID=UPI000F78736F|nr:GNAT family N-acetyltransferase [Nonomuraea sp. WAC 01424]RSN06669.1 GNAT family N-acetyltransferase [Nonomuraea sp. WAC 01424]